MDEARFKLELAKKDAVIDALSSVLKDKTEEIKRLETENDSNVLKLKTHKKHTDEVQRKMQTEVDTMRTELSDAMQRRHEMEIGSESFGGHNQSDTLDNGSESLRTYERWTNSSIVHQDKKSKWKNITPSSDYQALKHQLDNAVKDQIQADKNYAEEMKKVMDLESQCENLRSENAKLSKNVSKLREKERSRKVIKHVSQGSNDVIPERARFETKLSSTERARNEVEKQLQELKHSLSQKDDEANRHQKTIGSLAKELDDIKQELGQTRDQLATLKKDEMKKYRIISQKELEIDALQKQNDDIASILQGVEEEVKALRNGVMQKDELIKQRELEMDSLIKEEDDIAALFHGVEEEIKALRNGVTQKDEILAQRDLEINSLLKENDDIAAVLHGVEEEVKALHDGAMQKDGLISQREFEIDSLRKALREMMSLCLRDNNPNIVDLSDQYRPTKLAGLMSELYDNQWTDVFEYIEGHWNGDGDFQERQCIQFLLHIVMEVYTFCTNKATVEWTSAINGLLSSTDKERLKMIKDNRKKNAFEALPHVQQSCLEALQHIPLSDDSRFDITIEAEAMKAYLNECIRLSWLMVVQDPPVYLQCIGWESKQQNVRMVDGKQDMSNTEINEDTGRIDKDRNTPDKLDRLNQTVIDKASNRKVAFVKEHYTIYTRSGEYIDYIVWPVMFFHEGGPLLSKGVAQGYRKVFSKRVAQAKDRKTGTSYANN